jgi:hypothetical protein
MGRMKMVLGQGNNIPQVYGNIYSKASTTAQKLAGNASLSASMIERIAISRPSCGSCGKRG